MTKLQAADRLLDKLHRGRKTVVVSSEWLMVGETGQLGADMLL